MRPVKERVGVAAMLSDKSSGKGNESELETMTLHQYQLGLLLDLNCLIVKVILSVPVYAFPDEIGSRQGCCG